MQPDGARLATRDLAMPGAFVHVGDDQRPRPSARPRLEPEHEPARRTTRAVSSAPTTTPGAFRGRDFFHAPDLDQRMKKYLVRLANETANHLIRDTLEPEHTNLLWKPMASVKGIEILRGYEHPDREGDAMRDATCLRGVAQVNASIEEFAMLFKLDTNRQLAEHGLLFNPDLLDMATLYSLVQPSGDHPRRYVGIKWCLVQSPSRFFRNRDFCYLECQKEFLDAHGRRGWVRSMHSIKMPCCPTLEKSHGIVRASLYRCGLIAVETEKPGVLDTTYTIEMDLKGHFPEIFQPKFLSQRIAALASIDRYLQQQRLSSSPLLGDLDIPKTKLKATCHHCFREFATFTKRYICRKCGEGVCKNCSDDWELDVPVIGRKKVRICTVCSAEARTCHATPRNMMAMGFGLNAEYAMMQQQQQYYGQTGRIRRSNSMPENYEYGESPFLRTAQEPPRSVHHTTTESMSSGEQMDPSEYFARQQQQLKQHHVRESQAHYRESDFATDLRDFHHGGIRGTTDLTGLWTEEDANYYGNRTSSYQQPQTDNMLHRRESQRQHRQSAADTRTGGFTFAPATRSRAPTEGSVLSGYRDRSETSSNYGRNGHIPPSARYTVVGNRLERANSFDAGRQLEEQHRQHHHYQQPQQVQFQQQRQFQHHQIRDNQRPYLGNSRQSNQPLNDVYSPSGPSPSRSHRYQEDQSPSSHSQSSMPYQQQRQSNGRVAFQHQAAPPRNIALDFARQPQNGPPPQRNIALEFASQSQAQHTAPRNIALAFAQSAAQPPRNVALEFAMQSQSAAPPRNVALEFVKQQASSSRYQTTPSYDETPPYTGPKIPWEPQPHDDDLEPPRSPDLVGGGEPVEYVESDNGEWIASDRWDKGVLDVPDFELEGGGEPLETRSCETCGAKQYIHEGVVESTCDCDIDDELTYQSTHSGQSSRDESRVSFRVEGNPFSASPTYSDLSGSRHNSFGSGKIKVSVDVDEVIPLLVERLSQQSLRNSFHHT